MSEHSPIASPTAEGARAIAKLQSIRQRNERKLSRLLGEAEAYLKAALVMGVTEGTFLLTALIKGSGVALLAAQGSLPIMSVMIATAGLASWIKSSEAKRLAKDEGLSLSDEDEEG